jgi:hypothetical protein
MAERSVGRRAARRRRIEPGRIQTLGRIVNRFGADGVLARDGRRHRAHSGSDRRGRAPRLGPEEVAGPPSGHTGDGTTPSWNFTFPTRMQLWVAKTRSVNKTACEAGWGRPPGAGNGA